jgi:hypothetical protein
MRGPKPMTFMYEGRRDHDEFSRRFWSDELRSREQPDLVVGLTHTAMANPGGFDGSRRGIADEMSVYEMP